MIPLPLLVVLAVFAVARVTHLVTTDAILDRPRAAVQDGGAGKLAYFVTCPWCVSIWAAAGVSTAMYLWHGYWFTQIGVLALAASWLTGWLETRALSD